VGITEKTQSADEALGFVWSVSHNEHSFILNRNLEALTMTFVKSQMCLFFLIFCYLRFQVRML